MCLTTKRIFPNVALKDIEVYKVYMMKDDDSDLISPIMDNVYPKGTEVITPESKKILSWRAPGESLWNRRVAEGYIHVCGNLARACLIQLELDILCDETQECVVWKCVIPKGTLYFRGENDDLCAKKIRLVEKLDFEDITVMVAETDR